MEQARLQQALELMGEIAQERIASGMLDAESKRITDNIDLFEAMIREAYSGVKLVVGGHHIMVVREDSPLPAEIASADTLIFDHTVAQAIWGDTYGDVLSTLALTPAETRDVVLRGLYYGRGK